MTVKCILGKNNYMDDGRFVRYWLLEVLTVGDMIWWKYLMEWERYRKRENKLNTQTNTIKNDFYHKNNYIIETKITLEFGEDGISQKPQGQYSAYINFTKLAPLYLTFLRPLIYRGHVRLIHSHVQRIICSFEMKNYAIGCKQNKIPSEKIERERENEP